MVTISEMVTISRTISRISRATTCQNGRVFFIQHLFLLDYFSDDFLDV